MAEGNKSLVPRWTAALHAVQILFAVVILGLDAYGIKYIAYNALIFSLVVCLCTMLVAAYLIASQTLIPKLYNVYAALALHVWLLIFWIVDLGLVANLAAMWGSGNRCFTTDYGLGLTYCYTRKRDAIDGKGLVKRDTTYGAYHGALAAGAVFAAVQLVTWALSAIILITAWNKQRTAAANTHPSPPPAAAGAGPTPHYTNPNNQAVPMEKYNQHQPAAVPQAHPQYATPQQHYVQPAQHQQQYPAPYPQDPIPRQDTVSPVSYAGTGYGQPPSSVGHVTPQQTGQAQMQYGYPAGAAEVHTDPYNPNVPELANHR